MQHSFATQTSMDIEKEQVLRYEEILLAVDISVSSTAEDL